TPQRIACDTSQKLSIRFGETIKGYLARKDLNVADLKVVPLVGTPKNVVKDIKQNVTFPLIDYELEGNGMQLTARQHLAEFYTATDFARWKPYLYDKLIYTIVKNKITLTAPR
ncbi:MAG: hypothetical protein II087_00615, partial [Muribaculaceae bacterium]|nr:hypothetical protein [Muribaculaceae bacterium]